MPSIAKLALSTLALFAFSADAAPLLSGLGGSGNAKADAAVVAGVKTDLKVFADAFVKVTTGGKTNTCDSVNLGLIAGTGLATSVRATLFSKLAVTQCLATYSDALACTEFGAYLAVSYYAYISGWAGATLFAALEPARVDRWHALQNGFCSSHGAPAGVCGGWDSQWNTFDSLSASVSADIKAAAKLNLQSSGLLLLCDTSAVLKAGIDGVIRIGADATAKVAAAVVVKGDVNADVKAKATLDATAAAVVDANAKIVAAAAADAKASLAAAAALKAKVDVKADIDVHANAKTGAVVHRDLLDVISVVGGAKGDGHGKGFLGLTGDRLDLGLAGAGKGKGFLGAVIA